MKIGPRCRPKAWTPRRNSLVRNSFPFRLPMGDSLVHFRAEFEVLLSGQAVPFFYTRRAVDLIVGGIQFNAVIMLYVLLKKVALPGFKRIQFANPFLSSPFCTAQIDRTVAFLPREDCLVEGRLSGQLKIRFAQFLSLYSSELHGKMRKCANMQMCKWANVQMGKWANVAGPFTNFHISTLICYLFSSNILPEINL